MYDYSAPGILPEGWLMDSEEITNDIVYVNSNTKERVRTENSDTHLLISMKVCLFDNANN